MLKFITLFLSLSFTSIIFADGHGMPKSENLVFTQVGNVTLI